MVFDWRGTLVTTLTEHEWVSHALAAVGMSPDAVPGVIEAIEAANGPEERLDAPGVDSDAGVHRATFMDVFADAQLEPELAEAPYALEADPHNPFALDVHGTFDALRQAGLQIAVLSDIHFDLRPVFAGVGLLDHVDTRMSGGGACPSVTTHSSGRPSGPEDSWLTIMLVTSTGRS